MNNKEQNLLMKKIADRALAASYFKDVWSDIRCLEGNLLLSPTNDDIFKSQRKNSLTVCESDISYYFFSGGSTSEPKMIPFTKK